MKRFLTLSALALAAAPLAACGASSPDWPALVRDATPAIVNTPCGPGVQWRKTLQTVARVKVRGTVDVIPECPEGAEAPADKSKEQ